MSFELTIRNVRLVDKSSPANILGSVDIRVCRMSTQHATEGRLIRAILFGDVAAFETGSACVPWVHIDHRNPVLFRFVGHKKSQLRKRPGMENAALFSPSPNPQTNALQIFEGNPLLRAFSERDDLLANSMIRISGKTKFFSREFLESALCRFGSLLLKLGSKAFVAVANAFDVRPAVPLPCRIGQDIINAEVTPEDTVYVLRSRIIQATSGRQIESLVSQDKIRLTLLRAKERFLALAANKRDFEPSTGGPDGNNLFLDLPGQNTKIVGNGPCKPVGSLAFLVQLVRIRHLSDTANYYLGTEGWKFLSSFGIGLLVQFELCKRLCLPGSSTQPIAAAIRFVQCVIQSGKRASVCFELNTCRKLHEYILSRMEGVAQFLQSPKDDGLLAPIR